MPATLTVKLRVGALATATVIWFVPATVDSVHGVRAIPAESVTAVGEPTEPGDVVGAVTVKVSATPATGSSKRSVARTATTSGWSVLPAGGLLGSVPTSV